MLKPTNQELAAFLCMPCVVALFLGIAAVWSTDLGGILTISLIGFVLGYIAAHVVDRLLRSKK